MPAPTGKIKLSGALSAPAKAPSRADARQTGSAPTKTSQRPVKTALSAFRKIFSRGPQTRARAQAEPPPASQNHVVSRQPKVRSSILPGGVWLWCLVGLAIGLGIWLGGRSYLRVQLASQLSSATSEEVALQSIDALLRLDANATVDVSRGLAHPEFMVANAAYRALTGQLDAWRSLTAAEQLRRMQQVVDELERVPLDLDQDHRILITGLASRIYADALSNRETGVAELLTACKRIMSFSDGRFAGQSALANVSDDQATRMVSSLNSLPVTSTSASASLRDEDASDPVPPPLPAASESPQRQIIEKSISDEDPSITPSEAPGEADSSQDGSSGLMESMPALERSSAIRSPGMPRLTSVTHDRLALSSSRANVQLTATSPARNVSNSAASLAQAAREEQAADATISGMEELPIEQLVRLLASLQPRVSQAAALTLKRKGMSDPNLALAMQLATGSTPERQELLQRIAARDDLDPRPWLLWMAADSEEPVREQAVGLLGPLIDNEVRRQLRLLLNKERDDQVAATIRRVLASSK